MNQKDDFIRHGMQNWGWSDKTADQYGNVFDKMIKFQQTRNDNGFTTHKREESNDWSEQAQLKYELTEIENRARVWSTAMQYGLPWFFGGLASLGALYLLLAFFAGKI